MRSIKSNDAIASSRLCDILYSIGKDVLRTGIYEEDNSFLEMDYLGKSKDFEFRQNVLERRAIISKLKSFRCTKCPDLLEHVLQKF